ncbi:MAG: S8 family serine peptidase [Acidobacteriota bacterium]
MKRRLLALLLVCGAVSLAPRALAMDPVYIIAPNGSLPADLAEMVAAAGGTLYRVFPEIGYASAISANPDFAANLEASNKIRGVQEDVPVQMTPTLQLWGIGTAGVSPEAASQAAAAASPAGAFFFPCQWNLQQVDVPGAWAQGKLGSPSVKVAVLDSGIDPNHIDLAGRVDLANSTSFLSPDSSACGPADEQTITDLLWHGSFVAGIITSNNLGVASVAPLTQVVAVKVINCTNFGLFVDWIRGILYAANLPDVDVINMSLQAIFPKSFGNGVIGAAFNKAVNFAQNQGKIVVSAAGNFGVNLDKDRNFLELPAQAGAGIAAWSGDIDGNLSSFSNHGRTGTWVGAGGGDFTPVTPSIPIPGCVLPSFAQDGIISVCASTGIFGCGTSSFLFGATGTSFSAPIVTGVAALVDGMNGGSLRPGQIKTILSNTADDLGPGGVDNIFSHGRVNAGRAVQ